MSDSDRLRAAADMFDLLASGPVGTTADTATAALLRAVADEGKRWTFPYAVDAAAEALADVILSGAE